jgi:hypothetical protein
VTVVAVFLRKESLNSAPFPVLRAASSHWCAAAISLQIERPNPAPSFRRIGPRQKRVNSFGSSPTAVLANLDVFHDRLLAALHDRVARTIGGEAGDYHISLRIYGWNAVSGRPVPSTVAPPHEVGVLFVSTAGTQAMATQIAKACNPYFFHFPLKMDAELPSYGFAFSPADIERVVSTNSGSTT